MNIKDLSFDQVKELLTLAANAPAPVAAPVATPDRTKAVNPLSEEDTDRLGTIGFTRSHNEQQEALWAEYDRGRAAERRGLGRAQYPGEFRKRLATKEGKAMDTFIRGGAIPAEYKAALNEGTTTQGGFLVPALYSMDLVQPLTNLSYLRSAGARILTVEGTNSFNVPAITYSAAATIGAEASSYTEVDPTLSQITFTPYKMKRLSQASEEVVADSRFDVWGNILQPDFEQAFSEGENNYFTTGTGTAQPQGIVTGAPTGVTLANASSQVTSIASADRLIDLYSSVDYKYRRLPSTGWMMHDATLKVVRQLKDTNNRYIVDLDHGMDGGMQVNIFGWPVTVNNTMAVPGASAKTILFGAFQYYWIADFGELALQRLNELYAANGQVGFRAYRRIDAHVMLSAAFSLLVQAAS